jgi:hypothetical protein
LNSRESSLLPVLTRYSLGFMEKVDRSSLQQQNHKRSRTGT